ncbi:Cytochrome c553 [Candidatus Terasakiella magnetica]|nr:Cytochrome c553 [Candidatus Terasakiella magnetica]
MKALAGLVTLGFLAAGAGPAGAVQSVPVMAESCALCHGMEGRSPAAMPSLAGREAETLFKALMGFYDGSRPATVMDRIVKGYDAAELRDLAEYFAHRPPEIWP